MKNLPVPVSDEDIEEMFVAIDKEGKDYQDIDSSLNFVIEEFFMNAFKHLS